jgi:dTDP-4-amino-4,6-dideoxygalactose transaminase
VELLDLAGLHQRLRPQLEAAFLDVLASGRFVGGQSVVTFEQQFATAHGAKAAAGCASGTDALALALRAAGVGPGDEVIVPAMTFVATAEAVLHAGATPVFADVDPVTLLIDGGSVRARTSGRTRAVIPVHLYGNPVPFDLLCTWRDAGLLVIEDACQAHLASWQGQLVGTVGDATCFSFYPGKNLGALGDAGMVLSNDEVLIDKVKVLRDHGAQEQYFHEILGYCSRLDALQAALLSVKLPYLEEWNGNRRRVAETYRHGLAGAEGLTVVPWGTGSVNHLLEIRIPRGLRDDARANLHKKGIHTGLHYPLALTQQPALKPWVTTACPNAELAASELLSLPLDPYMTDAQTEWVCGEVKLASSAS